MRPGGRRAGGRRRRRKAAGPGRGGVLVGDARRPRAVRGRALPARPVVATGEGRSAPRAICGASLGRREVRRRRRRACNPRRHGERRPEGRAWPPHVSSRDGPRVGDRRPSPRRNFPYSAPSGVRHGSRSPKAKAPSRRAPPGKLLRTASGTRSSSASGLRVLHVRPAPIPRSARRGSAPLRRHPRRPLPGPIGPAPRVPSRIRGTRTPELVRAATRPLVRRESTQPIARVARELAPP